VARSASRFRISNDWSVGPQVKLYLLLIKRQGVVLAELVFSPPWAGQLLAVDFSLATRQHNVKRRWL
jgi:hypothetical protein